MKKIVLIVFGFIILSAGAGSVIGNTVSTSDQTVAVRSGKITLEQARNAALKKIPGTVEDEYTFEDEDEKITTYVFVIKNKDGKFFEVQIDADKGDVLSSEEVEDDSDDEDPPSI